MFENILVERKPAVAIVAIHRPAVLNALNSATMKELQAVFDQIRVDDEVRVVIITGAGEKSFVAGADIGEIALLDEAAGKRYSRFGQSVFDSIEQLGKPVIAAVNGFALGGGCELAMACTLRIASENAIFGQPEVKLGLIPGYGGTQRLVRLVGRGRAAQMLITGETIDAAEALRIGLVNQIAPRQELLAAAEAVAKKVIANAPLAVKFCLEAMERGMEFEATAFGLCCATEDMKQGTAAFLEKRVPVFKGK
jgi:enoyl-CoA hydratase/carnithine racemase